MPPRVLEADAARFDLRGVIQHPEDGFTSIERREKETEYAKRDFLVSEIRLFIVKMIFDIVLKLSNYLLVAFLVQRTV